MRVAAGRFLVERVHVLALAAWLGVLVTAGFVAAVIFPAMKALDPTIPMFARYPSDHWAIAAGMVMEKVFAAVDAASLLLVLVAVATLVLDVLMSGPRHRGWVLGLRLMVVGVAAATVGYSTLSLHPSMNTHLDAFRDAARDGEIDAADRERAAFDAAHPTATRVMGTQAVALVAGLVLALVPPRPKKTGLGESEQ